MFCLDAKKSKSAPFRLLCALLFAAAVFCAAVLFFSCRSVSSVSQKKYTLQLTDAKTGVVYASFALDENEGFSVLFKHSVNQSTVEEGYAVRGGVIFLDWCLYSSFGAGVADNLEKGQMLTFTDDGRMKVSGFNRRIPRLSYEVSTVYDHFLRIGGKQINLTELGLKGKRIEFRIKTNRFSGFN